MPDGAMNIEVGKLLSQTGALLKKNAASAAAAMILMTGGGLVIDLYAEDPVRFGWPLTILQFLLQYWLTREMLSRLDRRSARAGGIGTFFLGSLLSGIGILLGIVLLVVPGLVLMVRWSAVGPIILAERVGATEALAKSWDATRGHSWPIFGALMIVFIPAIVGFAAMIADPDSRNVATLLVYNIGFSVSLLIGWHAAVAIYMAIEPKPKRLEEIFA
jgi:hypothetical protein